MEFPRQEYWGGLPFPSPEPGMETESLAFAGRFFTTTPPGKPNFCMPVYKKKEKKRKENNDSECQKILLTICSFHTVHRVLKARILKWFAIPFSSGPRFVRSLQED